MMTRRSLLSRHLMTKTTLRTRRLLPFPIKYLSSLSGGLTPNPQAPGGSATVGARNMCRMQRRGQEYVQNAKTALRFVHTGVRPHPPSESPRPRLRPARWPCRGTPGADGRAGRPTDQPPRPPEPHCLWWLCPRASVLSLSQAAQSYLPASSFSERLA